MQNRHLVAYVYRLPTKTSACSGIGIERDHLDSVFDLFAQAGQAGSERSRGGLGIGLHLARKIIIAHEGQLEVASEGLGRGSTFTVKLPRLGHQPSVSSANNARENPSPRQ